MRSVCFCCIQIALRVKEEAGPGLLEFDRLDFFDRLST